MVDSKNLEKLRKEYLTSGSVGLRPLCRKYNLCYSTVTKRAIKEGWTEQKDRYQQKLVAGLVEVQVAKERELAQIEARKDISDYEHSLSAARTLAVRLDEYCNRLDMDDIAIKTRSINQLTAALKDIIEITGGGQQAQEPITVEIAGAEDLAPGPVAVDGDTVIDIKDAAHA